ncbi:MAG: hypothetical protein V7607_1193 [Solirubrobacteraceae bacterium]
MEHLSISITLDPDGRVRATSHAPDGTELWTQHLDPPLFLLDARAMDPSNALHLDGAGNTWSEDLYAYEDSRQLITHCDPDPDLVASAPFLDDGDDAEFEAPMFIEPFAGEFKASDEATPEELREDADRRQERARETLHEAMLAVYEARKDATALRRIADGGVVMAS